MDSTIIVALIAFAGTALGAYFANRKTTALFTYRLDQLEAKVTLHNNLVERVYGLEEHAAVTDEKIKVANNRLEDLEKK